MRHPNLFFTRYDAESFRERMKTDGNLKKRYEEAVAKTEEYLKEEFITEQQANGRNTQSQHADFGSVNGQAGRLCAALGIKYAVEGDERCAERLKELLLHLISFERWYGASYTRRVPVPWHADLCSAAITLTAADIYDIIFDCLTESERRVIADGILEKGVYAVLGDWVLPEKRIHALDSMGHNWWSVCITDAACAFLALSDHVDEEKRKSVLNCVDNALADYLTYPGSRLFNKLRNFDDKGLFYESVNYNSFGTGSLLRYLWCSERYFGRNDVIRNAIPKELCDGTMKFSYPCTRNGRLFFDFPAFGDHSPDGTIEFLSKYAVLCGIASSAMKAYASAYPNDIRDLIRNDYAPENLKGSVDYLPLSEVYSSGYAVKRSSWERDATLFAVKSGYCWNHSHNDSGSFVIYHKGKPFFIDSGTCGYDSPLYHDYYCQDKAHSVLMIGGNGRREEELYRGTRFPGAITDRFESDGLFYVQADGTGPMAHLCSRMYRNFIWINDRILVIFDDVYCHEENTVQLTLHFNGGYTQNGGGVDFTYEDCRARLLSLAPAKMPLTERRGHLDHMQEEDAPYIELSDEEKKRAHVLINILELDNDEHDTVYTPLYGENAIGVRIAENGVERDIWFNIMADGHIMHDNSNNIIGGYDTDAYMLVITKDKLRGTEKALMITGSYLRRNGKVYISSFTKLTKETMIEA